VLKLAEWLAHRDYCIQESAAELVLRIAPTYAAPIALVEGGAFYRQPQEQPCDLNAQKLAQLAWLSPRLITHR